MPNGVCLVCIDLVVVDVWVGECMGIWVSGFLVPSHYLLSGISTSTWYFYFYWLLLTLALTSGFYPYPWSLVMSCRWSVNFWLCGLLSGWKLAILDTYIGCRPDIQLITLL